MRGIDAVAEILKREGVEYLFSYPNNAIIDSAARIGIRPIIARGEKTLINIADGYARATNGRRPTVLVVQQASGIENAFGGFAQAYADSIPMLMIPGGPPISRGGEAGRAWTLQCYLDGADGLLPWLALGTPKAWEKEEDTALLLPPKAGMEKRAYATLRLKALRRGQQDVELLHLLLQKMKASREEVRGGIAQALGLLGDFKKTSEVDAGRIDYGHLDSDKFEALRRALLEALDK